MVESEETMNDGELFIRLDFNHHGDSETHNYHHVTQLRKGTISSARFNILCTMVGGGCLSLPLAFQKSGSLLLGPISLLVITIISHYCYTFITAAVRKLSPVTSATSQIMGTDSYESLTKGAFGRPGLIFSQCLVTFSVFFTLVGYCVLLRDMLEPIAHAIFHQSTNGPSLPNNTVMLLIAFIMTPVSTFKTLSALKHTGAASMSAIVLLGICLVYRSSQCNLGDDYHDGVTNGNPWSSLSLWPDSPWEVLDALPIYISCYVCHYNIPLVHNELTNPTERRVSLWITTTTWAAALFYLVIGVAGAAYGHCTPSGNVQGNILLDFDEHDPLLLVARFSLAITVAMALPMLVVPARNVLLECFFKKEQHFIEQSIDEDPEAAALHPFLNNNQSEDEVGYSFVSRLVAAVTVLWGAAALASCVQSIAIVWDLLGSSISVFLSYLIPCGAYIVIVCMNKQQQAESEKTWMQKLSFVVACLMLLIFTPLMIFSTYNAVVNTFFSPSK